MIAPSIKMLDAANIHMTLEMQKNNELHINDMEEAEIPLQRTPTWHQAESSNHVIVQLL